jgi:CubicO group peptidase (beta-lactamase class C family)
VGVANVEVGVANVGVGVASRAPAELDDGWPVAAPERQGMDGAMLRGIAARFTACEEARAHAVVVARHGALVYEHYFTGEDWRWTSPLGVVAFDSAVRHDLRSITKSVTSLLVGVALDRGWIDALDTPVFTYFPEHDDLRSSAKDRITLAHLLTMSAGFAWDERGAWDSPGNNERLMDQAADPYRYVLEQDLATAPGQAYDYCGGAPTLLQGVIQKTSGKALDLIAREALFAPLAITDVEWTRFPSGDVRGYGGLRLRTRDLAKIGQLVLDRGVWQGRPIIRPEWIAASTAPQINGEGIFFYGHLWWLGRFLVDRREIRWIAGIGNGGQRLYIVPRLELVVAVNAGAYSAPQVVGEMVLKRHVLPAIFSMSRTNST